MSTPTTRCFSAFATKKAVNSMTHRTYLLPLVLALPLLLSLTACGDSSSDDPQSGYETVMDMDFLDGMWSIDGTSMSVLVMYCSVKYGMELSEM